MTEPMTILLIADGRSGHTQRWVEYFADRGHSVHLVTYDPMNREIPGVTEYLLTSYWSNHYLSFLPRQLKIRKLISKIRPDIVHAHFVAKYGFHLPGLGFQPTIVSAWGDDILVLPKQSWLIRIYTTRVLGSVDLVYAVSNDIRNHIICDFGIPGSRVKYLPFGIDTDLFIPEQERASREADRIDVFTNRGFYPVYDNATLIRGFSRACKDDPRLYLTFRMKGNGPDEVAIRRLVADLGISDRVSFKPQTDYSEVPLDYRKADIYITTSISDGTPVSILEAMASGLPCIATSVGGIPEWVENQKTGLLIPPGSPDAVAKAILLLASDPALRSQMGSAAREVVVRNGQWKSLMAQAEKDYLALIETYRKD